jgi:hypothetical protein
MGVMNRFVPTKLYDRTREKLSLEEREDQN